MSNTWNQTETLFAFMGWLTTRKERTVLSSHDNAAPAVELIKQFSDRHGLPETREGWENQIVPEYNTNQP